MSFGEIARRLFLRPSERLANTDSQAGRLIASYLRDVTRSGDNWRFTVRETDAFREILAGGDELIADCWAASWEHAAVRVKALAARQVNSGSTGSYRELEALAALIGELHRRKLRLPEPTLIRVLRVLANHLYVDRACGFSHWLPVSGAIRFVEKHCQSAGLSSRMRQALSDVRVPTRIQSFEGQAWDSTPAEDRRIRERIHALLDPQPTIHLDPSERWAGRLQSWIESGEPSAVSARRRLGEHALTISGARPAASWQSQAREALSGVGTDAFTTLVNELFPLAEAKPGCEVTARNATMLQGLVWCCALIENQATVRAVGSLAERMYRKVQGVGAMSPRVGNACVRTLERMGGQESVAQLARLSLRVKDRTGLRLIQEALDSAADRMGKTVEELAEITVPTYGLEMPGVLRAAIGRFDVRATIDGAKLGDWTWTDEKGKSQKSVPAEVKAGHAAEWKELQAAGKEIDKMLPAQRDRIERLMASERSIPFPDWRDRYLDHPLLAGFVRRLIWHFDDGHRAELGMWMDNRVVGLRDVPLDWLADDTRVRLWHPAGAAPENVLAWRDWLVRRQVTQPFKQAHREVYLLTDAELHTATYSNRFAAHILKQHQFAALCRQRGWRYKLQGWFDSDDSVPTIELPAWGLYAEFWVEPVTGEENQSDTGISLYVTTDQVRFYDRHGAQLPLMEVPALAFTEVMRDVDLFVGVSSAGNDPEWQDGGPNGRYREYWHNYSFGDLSVTAETRRVVLEKLIPRLKIATRCSIKGRFLVVRGDLRTYKIHLGSGNILMEPNDQYLCIVPDRSPRSNPEGKLYLPFEGDATLSLILSKAFMLADDTRITDKTILTQLKR